MDPAILAYARQKSLFNRLEVTSNNVANVNTSGFKADLAVYSESTNRIDGEKNPSPHMNVAVDLSQGPIAATYRQLDVAIEGEGFFAVDSPLGTRYTRAGSFTINQDGLLVTKEGYPVQSDGGQITFEPDDHQFEIAYNGEVYALKNGTQELRGQIGVFNFTDKSSLEKAGESYFKSSENPQLAIPNEEYTLAQGMLEQSNVNSVKQVTELIDVSRSVQQVAKIISDQHDLIRNSVTRITTQD